MFGFTNPDCVSEITIDRISIIKDDGAVIYEGLLLNRDGVTQRTWPMKPHESCGIDLAASLIAAGVTDLLDKPSAAYTVEIFWTGSKEGLPLIGWAYVATGKLDAEGNIIENVSTSSVTEMVNMEQKLTPGKAK